MISGRRVHSSETSKNRLRLTLVSFIVLEQVTLLSHKRKAARGEKGRPCRANVTAEVVLNSLRQLLEVKLKRGDNPTMIVIADAKKRIVLPGAKPGDCFDVKIYGQEVRLTLLKPAQMTDRARLVKKKGYTVAVGTRPITQEQVRTALDEFR